jgi:hypothetical protein
LQSAQKKFDYRGKALQSSVLPRAAIKEKGGMR